jgi:hypothetical protein
MANIPCSLSKNYRFMLRKLIMLYALKKELSQPFHMEQKNVCYTNTLLHLVFNVRSLCNASWELRSTLRFIEWNQNKSYKFCTNNRNDPRSDYPWLNLMLFQLSISKKCCIRKNYQQAIGIVVQSGR